MVRLEKELKKQKPYVIRKTQLMTPYKKGRLKMASFFMHNFNQNIILGLLGLDDNSNTSKIDSLREYTNQLNQKTKELGERYNVYGGVERREDPYCEKKDVKSECEYKYLGANKVYQEFRDEVVPVLEKIALNLHHASIDTRLGISGAIDGLWDLLEPKVLIEASYISPKCPSASLNIPQKYVEKYLAA